MDELFPENLQNTVYVQTSKLIIYKNKQTNKLNMIIWTAIEFHNTVTGKHFVEVTALTRRINKNNNTYQLSGPQLASSSQTKVEWVVTQYQTHNTWNMTEASQCMYTLICPLTGPATNHCPGNGLGHLQIVEHPNVHIISLLLVVHYAYEHWLIAIEPYDRIPTPFTFYYVILQNNLYIILHHSETSQQYFYALSLYWSTSIQ